MPRSVRKTKSVRAPQGFHWMRKGVNRYTLMRHSGPFVPHAGASLTAKFEIQEKHRGA
tara:strand:+ start:510 stop:683 length:174 start_codon:yes stop_codon:yes gene_type:complete